MTSPLLATFLFSSRLRNGSEASLSNTNIVFGADPCPNGATAGLVHHRWIQARWSFGRLRSLWPASVAIFTLITILPATANTGGIVAMQDNETLVQGSRQAIIETGFSATYFDQHFKLVET